jgi:adenylate cyclase
MAEEIERTFLVEEETWRPPSRDPVAIRQGYFETADAVTVRIRTKRPVEGSDDPRATLCIKGRPDGLTRPEFEYDIPLDDAREMLSLFCGGRTVEKTRFHLDHEGHTWEIDRFEGDHDGLVLAEIELQSESAAFSRPGWLGSEVTDDPAYLNEVLAREGLPEGVDGPR